MMNNLYKFIINSIQALYQSYLYIKTTYPLNTFAVILFTAYIAFIVIKYVKRGLSGLLSSEISYNYEPNLDSKNVG